jgi:hypothetical protein
MPRTSRDCMHAPVSLRNRPAAPRTLSRFDLHTLFAAERAPPGEIVTSVHWRNGTSHHLAALLLRRHEALRTSKTNTAKWTGS